MSMSVYDYIMSMSVYDSLSMSMSMSISMSVSVCVCQDGKLILTSSSWGTPLSALWAVGESLELK